MDRSRAPVLWGQRAPEMVYRFGQIELDQEAYELRREGASRHVEPKVLDLLLYLVQHRDRLVTKSELLDRVWPDAVVAESALTRAMSLARAAVGDSGRGHSVIETVTGRGYRFRAEVEMRAAPLAEAVPLSGTTPSAPPPIVAPPPLAVRQRRPRMLRSLLQGVAGVLAVLLVAGWLTWPAPLGFYLDAIGLADPPAFPPLPDEPSIAVLPFASLGPALERGYLADGIADELTVDLGRLRELFVSARSSAFTYRNTDANAKRVGRELGVRYVVEGTVRADGERAVVSAQLVDAQSGFQLWSGRYERVIDDVLALQADISAEILQALGVRIARAEVERAGGTSAATSRAHTAYLLARMHWHGFTRDDNRKAETLLNHALTLEPENPQVHALLASTHIASYGAGWDPGVERLEQGRSAALRALELDPFSSRAYASLAAANLWTDHLAEAVQAARRAVALGPNSDLCFGVQAMALAADGQLRAAIQSLNRALRLNPRHPALYWMLLGYLHETAGRGERAAAIWERVREANPDLIPPRLELLRLYDARDRYDEARALAHEILHIDPAFTAEVAVRINPRKRDAEAATLFRMQLQRAGLP